MKTKLITTGVIREIKIIDQFEDQTLRASVDRYKTCTAICGYLSCALPLYLLSEHRFPFDSKFRNIVWKKDSDPNLDGIESKEDEQSESESAKTLQAIIDRLCDAPEISEYVSSAMQFILRDRQKYIEHTPNAFASDKERAHYLRAWVANYEISRFIEAMKCDHTKYVVFLRCNQYLEVEVANPLIIMLLAVWWIAAE